MNFNTTELNELIRTRRSVWPKQFAPGEQVEDAIIEQLLENANWAPNHGLTEPWRFTVFAGDGLQTFADWQSALYKKHKEGEAFREDKYLKMQKNPLLASHIISIGMKRCETGKIPEIEEVMATACAVQNMYLTAHAYGIGCYWTTGGVTFIDEAKEFLGLGADDKLLGFLYVGQIAKPTPLGRRKSISEKVNWIK